MYRKLMPQSNGRRVDTISEKRQNRCLICRNRDPWFKSLAVKVMAEAGVDISLQKSKRVSEFVGIQFDYVLTVCSDADEHCPIFPGKTIKIHHGFDDPPKLAQMVETEEEKLNCYRRVRDEIKAYVETFPEGLVKEMEG